jgi:ABC-type sulfate/molybdate transport systems ATPase subunit/uncharacterized protein YdcH (DUF465 family)
LTAPVVSLTGVTVRYDGVLVLDVPALGLEDGEILGVIGPNGSGKSTLLRVIGLLETPATGAVRVRGARPAGPARLAARRRMASVFQGPLLADTTVAENVALGLRFRGVPAAPRRSRVERWLDRFGIRELAGRSALGLSAGEAQRVALARALVLEPEVLLLDEPFAALDPPARDALLADLGPILRRERVSTVFVTHERTEAQALADRVAVLLRGRVVQLDTPERLFHAPVSEEVARFVGVETIAAGHVRSVAAGLALVEVGAPADPDAGGGRPRRARTRLPSPRGRDPLGRGPRRRPEPRQPPRRHRGAGARRRPGGSGGRRLRLSPGRTRHPPRRPGDRPRRGDRRRRLVRGDRAAPHPTRRHCLTSLSGIAITGSTFKEVVGMDQASLIERLTAENEEFRRLRTEHHVYDEEIGQIQQEFPLSPDQQWRISELKKLKLMAKDRMEAIIRHARHSVTA